MKTLVYLISLIFLLSSCIEMSFEEPQPQGIADETVFPEKLQGKYIADTSSTITISETNVKFTSDNKNDDINSNLADTLILRTYKKYHFVNFKDGDYWELYVLKQRGKKLDVLALNNDTVNDNAKLKAITELKTVNHESGTLDRYTLKPTQDELIKILKKGIFEKVATFKKVDE